MLITGLGINGDGNHLRGSLKQLDRDLAFFQDCGFDAVELAVDGLDVVVNGRLHQAQCDRVRAIVDEFDFCYAVHAPNRLNLAFPSWKVGGVPDMAHEQAVFCACLDFCAAIEAGIFVYHSGLIALQEFAYGLEEVPDDAALAAARSCEVEALQSLMPCAAERGVVVAMENRDPHPWEVAVLRQAGIADDQLGKYHPGMLVPDLVAQVQAVNHPNLGLTLDLGHLYLAARYCGFDYLDALRKAAPYIRHLHGSDNFGRLGGVFDNIPVRIPYGEGDLHLPPGWGEIPFVDALGQLTDYEGLFILEIRPRFYDHFGEARQTMLAILETVAG